MEKVYNKLVRDQIPNIIKGNGETPITRILSDVEYREELEKKLYEEYMEVIDAKGDERIEELADMLEVMVSLAELENMSLGDIVDIAQKKAEERGAFEERIYLEKVI